MKNRLLTAISTVMIFVPWTILPLRRYDWALESPNAEIMIGCYIAFMIFSGIFTLISYKNGTKNSLMKICLVINLMYMTAGIVLLGNMLATRFL